MFLLSHFRLCIYRLKFNAFFDINNFVDDCKIQFYSIDKLPLIWEIPIYQLVIFFPRYIIHPLLYHTLSSDVNLATTCIVWTWDLLEELNSLHTWRVRIEPESDKRYRVVLRLDCGGLSTTDKMASLRGKGKTRNLQQKVLASLLGHRCQTPLDGSGAGGSRC